MVSDLQCFPFQSASELDFVQSWDISSNHALLASGGNRNANTAEGFNQMLWCSCLHIRATSVSVRRCKLFLHNKQTALWSVCFSFALYVHCMPAPCILIFVSVVNDVHPSNGSRHVLNIVTCHARVNIQMNSDISARAGQYGWNHIINKYFTIHKDHDIANVCNITH